MTRAGLFAGASLFIAGMASAQAPAPPAPPRIVPPPASPSGVTIEKSAREMVVQADGTFLSTQELIVRVDRADAVRNASTVPLPVSASLQTFELLEAYTELPDGRRLDVKPESVLTQAPPYAAQMQTLSDVQLKVINFPGVTVGAKLHLKTRIAQTTAYFPNVFTTSFAAGPSTVIRDATILIDMPQSMPLKADMAGMNATAPEKKGDRRLYRWAYTQPEAHPPQPGALAPIDGPQHLVLTTLPDWAGLARAYQSRATEREVPSAKVKALAESLTKGLKGDLAKAAALSMWVQRQVRYINIVLDTGGFVPASADEVLDTHYGDCKGHATLLNALLAAVGIKSTSVLINAGPTYRAPDVAGQIFNHMINYLPAFDLFVDTTNPFTDFGDLPEQDRGKFVVLTRSGETKRTPIKGPERDAVTSDFTLAVTPEGGIDGKSDVVPSGSPRGALRAFALASRGTDPAQIGAGMMRASGSPGAATIEFPNPDGPAPAIRLRGTWHIDDAVTPSGTGALKLPYGVAMLNLPTVAGGGIGAPPPTQPITCGSATIAEHFSISFPPGYEIVGLPTGNKVDTAEISYSSAWSRDGQTIAVTRSYATHFPGLVCAPDTIARTIQAKREVMRDLGQQIVYRRKEGAD